MMSSMSRSWQAQLSGQIVEALRSRGLLTQAWLLGSAATGNLDHWSDLDLGVVTGDVDAVNDLAEWLPAFESVWVRDRTGRRERTLHRVIYQDGTGLDLIVAGDRMHIGLPGRQVFPDGRLPAVHYPTPASADGHVQTPADWFLKAAIAAKKLGRDDLLIGLHLALDLAQDCLVAAMLLRDDAAGTSHHRHGGAENETVRLIGAQMPGATAQEIGAYIMRLAVLYAELVERSGLQSPDPNPLAALIEQVTRRPGVARAPE